MQLQEFDLLLIVFSHTLCSSQVAGKSCLITDIFVKNGQNYYSRAHSLPQYKRMYSVTISQFNSFEIHGTLRPFQHPQPLLCEQCMCGHMLLSHARWGGNTPSPLIIAVDTAMAARPYGRFLPDYHASSRTLSV